MSLSRTLHWRALGLLAVAITMGGVACKQGESGNRGGNGAVVSTQGAETPGKDDPADNPESTYPAAVSGTNLTTIATFENAVPICASYISGDLLKLSCVLGVKIGGQFALADSGSTAAATGVKDIDVSWSKVVTDASGNTVRSFAAVAGFSANYAIALGNLSASVDVDSLSATLTVRSTVDGRVRSSSTTAPVDPPGPPASLTATAGPRSCTAQLTMDGATAVVVRTTGGAISWSPTDGQVYSAGDVGNGERIVFSGSALSFVDGGLTAGATYGYAVFVRNSAGKYSDPTETTCTPTTGGSGLDIFCTNGSVNAVATNGSNMYFGGSFTKVGYCVGGGVSVSGTTAELATAFNKSLRPNGGIHAVVSDGSGGWFVGGTFTYIGGVNRQRLAHVLSDGSIGDFNPGADGTVWTMLLSGTTLYVGGDFTQVGGVTRTRLAALSTSGLGSVLNTWSASANNTVYTMQKVSTTLYVGGAFTLVNGTTRNRLAAISSDDGTLGPGFDPNMDGTVRASALSGTTLYVGGTFDNVGASSRVRVAAFNGSTGALLTFNDTAAALSGAQVNALYVASSKVFVGGSFTSSGGDLTLRSSIVRLVQKIHPIPVRTVP